ncbi:MAG: 3-deoxy-D-manno-octulosonic acid transferase [Alphaproteobacteria bacterium]|nr:3-deoxy-D-manno-octulosonic acid transferase [Alphaproteobacteria bacterium]MBV9693751.1 3-deoxy-D-manno-octulosonic acid transferase [Alphaproteobacteria bacterium]
MAKLPPGYRAYRAATSALAPAVPLMLRRRMQSGREERNRANERLARNLTPRPEGPLIWIHGASVGECLAALPLIEALLADPHRNVLVTSGTVTSAKLMAQRLPPRAVHQYIPVDLPAAAARFLDHWRPDVGLFVDSDIWPNLIVGAQQRGVPLALVNARMSERSFAGWRWAPRTAAALLSAFDVCLAQDEVIAQRFRTLGARRVETAGSLKADAPPLPADAERLAELRKAVGGRPVLLAAQTHPGEDETVLPASDMLRREFSDLLTILVPRHVGRGAELEMLSATRFTRRRSKGELPDPGTTVYVADTMGELGLFYRLAPFAFVGGSLIRHGGQNPLEPARLQCAVLAGPHTFNFDTAFAAIFKAQAGIGLVHSSAEIAALAQRLLTDRAETKRLGEEAGRAAATLGGATANTVAAVEQILKRHASA